MKRETIDLFNRIFKVLEPPPDLTLSQWADRYRRLSSESGSKGGKWNTEKAPWQREIMDAITDISVEKVVVMSAAQMGKTDAFLLNTIGYYMHYDPCTILCMQPTLSLAETMSKDRLMPMVRDTPALRDKINEKSRTAGNTIFKKAFPGGRITMTGANSPTELRSRPIRILLADEIDAYPPTAGAEGDPLILAGKRLTTYWNRKEVDTSTPTIKGASRIEMEYEHSTMEEWNVPCPSCGELQPLEWSNLIYKVDADGEIESTTYVCAKCGVKGTTEVVSVKHILVVTPKKLNPGKVATAAAAEVSGEYAVSYYATYIDGKKKLEIDPLNYIYYVNGKDYLADVRKALGK